MAHKSSVNLVKTQYRTIASAPELQPTLFSSLIKLDGQPIKWVSKQVNLVLPSTSSSPGKSAWRFVQKRFLQLSSISEMSVSFPGQPSLCSITVRLTLCSDTATLCGGHECLHCWKILQLLQNRCTRSLTQTKYGSVDLEALLKELGWLNFQQLVDFDTIVVVHNSINGNAQTYLSELFAKPKEIHSHYTRSAKARLFPSHFNLKFRQKAFQIMDASYGISWTGLLKQLIFLFRRKLWKTFLSN